MRSDLLELASPTLFGFVPTPESPEAAEEAALLATARGARWDGGRLRFDLLLAWTFGSRFVAEFHELTDGIVFVVEDAGSGRAFAMRAVDPHKKFLEKPAPNWRGSVPFPTRAPAPADGAPAEEKRLERLPPPADGLDSGWITIPCEVAAAPPPWRGPSVFVTAALHRHVSNTVAFEIAASGVATTSWLASRPWSPALHAPSGPPTPPAAPPPPGAPALVLTPRAATPGRPPVVDARLRLTSAELQMGGSEAWLRSVFLLAISRASQVPHVASWLGERIVLADDVQVGPGGGEASLAFDLASAFGHPLPPGDYHVHVSARHHRSDALEVHVP